jgi:parallel beta-helix repeat protein
MAITITVFLVRRKLDKDLILDPMLNKMVKPSRQRFRIIIVLTLIVLISVFYFPNVQNAQASFENNGTIYIRADGSVYPSIPQIRTSEIYGDEYYCFDYSILFEEERDAREHPIVIERDNIVLDGKNFRLTGYGGSSEPAIKIVGRTNITIRNLQVNSFEKGILIDNSKQIKLENNSIGSFFQSNVVIKNSESIDVTRNKLIVSQTDAYPDGIRIINSEDCLISDNSITGGSESGIHLTDSNDNSIHGNSIAASNGGIYLERSEGNRIYWNNIRGLALYSDSSSGNQIYQNNFLGYIVSKGSSVNRWDNGYPTGGNFWNGYNGTDLCINGNRNITQSDGIGDIPYVIDSNNQDTYPLMGMYNNFLTDKMSGYQRVTIIANSEISAFSYEVPIPLMGRISLVLEGPAGFCRICVPKALLNASYLVELDEELLNNNVAKELPFSGNSFEYLYVTYSQGAHTIKVTGSTYLVALSSNPVPHISPTISPSPTNPPIESNDSSTSLPSTTKSTAGPTSTTTSTSTPDTTRQPNPTIPEFPTIIFLLFLLVIYSIGVLFLKNVRKKKLICLSCSHS